MTYIYILLIILISISYPAHSGDLALSKNARTTDYVHSGLFEKSLAGACLTQFFIPDSIPCSPSMVPFIKTPNLSATGLISNGYATLAKANNMLKADATSTTINEIFSGERVLQVESHINLFFNSKRIASRYTPYSIKYFSAARNDANPEIDLSLVQESSLAVQTGFLINNFTSVGIQIRKTDWKFIKKRFFLLDTATPAGLEGLKPKTFSGIFLEPAVTIQSGGPWNPRFTFMYANLGETTEKYDNFKISPELQGGVGFRFPINIGILDTSLEYRSLSPDDSDEDKIHLGTSFSMGSMNIGFGIDNRGTSLGTMFILESFNSGILYTTTQVPWKDNSYFAQTVYVQVGWQL